MISKTALAGLTFDCKFTEPFEKNKTKKQENYLRALKRSLPDSIFNFIIVIFILRMQTLKNSCTVNKSFAVGLHHRCAIGLFLMSFNINPLDILL